MKTAARIAVAAVTALIAGCAYAVGHKIGETIMAGEPLSSLPTFRKRQEEPEEEPRLVDEVMESRGLSNPGKFD